MKSLQFQMQEYVKGLYSKEGFDLFKRVIVNARPVDDYIFNRNMENIVKITKIIRMCLDNIFPNHCMYVVPNTACLGIFSEEYNFDGMDLRAEVCVFTDSFGGSLDFETGNSDLDYEISKLVNEEDYGHTWISGEDLLCRYHAKEFMFDIPYSIDEKRLEIEIKKIGCIVRFFPGMIAVELMGG